MTGAAREWLDTVRRNMHAEGPQVLRIVIAVAVSWQLCVWLGSVQPPIYAVLVPLVAMRDAPGSAFNVSLARLVGVVGGLLLGMVVLSWLKPSAIAVSVVMLLALAIGIAVRIGGVLNLQIAISALMLFANADPSSYALARLWETAVGAAVTIVLAPLLFPTNPARAFSRALDDVATSSGENLVLAADLLAMAPETTGGDGSAREELARRLQAQVSRVDDQARKLPAQLAAARRAVRLHPRWRRRHTQELADLVRPTEVAPEIAELIRVHVADATELGSRVDAQDWRAAAAPLVRPVALPLAEAVTAELSGEPNPAAVEQATSAIRADMAADPTRLGAVIRRPLRRLVALLAGLDEPNRSPAR